MTITAILSSLEHIEQRYGDIGRLLAEPDPDIDHIVRAMASASDLCAGLPSPVNLTADELVVIRSALERVGIRRAEVQAAVEAQHGRLATALRDLERGGHATRQYAADAYARRNLTPPQFVDRHG
jgi:hypothetical protein